MYVVTGGAGFIGSAVIWRLNRAGITDILVVDNLGHADKWKNLVNRRYADYLHRSEFLRLLRDNALPGGIQGMVHLGACSDTTQSDADFLMFNNVAFSQHVCRYATERGIRLVHASSASTYGNGSAGFASRRDVLPRLKPLNMYAYSKHFFDLWLLGNGLDGQVASLKFFNVYGPNEYHKGSMRSVACKAFEEITATGRMRLFRSSSRDYADGGQMRDFVYVKDCAEVVFWLLRNPEVNGFLNVGTGRARTWNDLARAVFAALGRQPAIEYVDMPESLRGKYQDFTQADMAWLEERGCPVRFVDIEAGVADYARYLQGSDPYLEMCPA